MPTQLHADTLSSHTHHSTCFAHFMWLKCDKRSASSVHLASCLCPLFLIHLVTSRLLCPHHQHLLLNLQRPPRPQHEAGVNPQAHPLAGGVRPTGRLVSTHKNDVRFSSTRKLVANTQIIITWRRYSNFFDKRNGEGLQLMRRSQWNPRRPMY